jgi:hypothetical protein
MNEAPLWIAQTKDWRHQCCYHQQNISRYSEKLGELQLPAYSFSLDIAFFEICYQFSTGTHHAIVLNVMGNSLISLPII